jgi:polyribonucleotide nucleotidyltransferase
MDLKIDSISPAIMQKALEQAREGRMHILGLMKESMGGHRTELSEYAPRMLTMKINPEKIRDVIGKGGSVIRALTEETGTVIDIQDDGTVTIASVDGAKAELAKQRIEQIAAEVEVGKIYEGPVLKILEFGAIVNIMPGRDGLLHVSQIANKRVENVSDYLKEGQVIRVKVIETDEKGKIRLSLKAVQEAEAPQQ